MTTLQAGDKAPEFTVENHAGRKVSLSQFRGKKVILYFYPHDDTPTCTKQSCNLKDNYRKLLRLGFVVLGVSEDSQKSHAKFKSKFKLPFPLLVDEDHELLKAYEVWGPKKFMGREFDGTHRTTFVIDEQGIIEHVIYPVKSGDHANQILSFYEKPA